MSAVFFIRLIMSQWTRNVKLIMVSIIIIIDKEEVFISKNFAYLMPADCFEFFEYYACLYIPREYF
jgi:hypothetical protein